VRQRQLIDYGVARDFRTPQIVEEAVGMGFKIDASVVTRARAEFFDAIARDHATKIISSVCQSLKVKP
jgi:hypothetical protein